MKLPGIPSRKVAFAPSDPPSPSERGPPTKGGSPSGSVSRDDFEVLSLLGVGGFGEVKLVKYLRDGQHYAMKAIEKSAIKDRSYIGDDKAQGRIQAERDFGVMSSKWKCPFLLQLYASFQTCDKLYFILEYCPHGDLFEYVMRQEDRKLEEGAVQVCVAEVCLALEHLHSSDAIHRDVKLENILISSEGHVKLADFGIAKLNATKEAARPSCVFLGSAAVLYPPEFQRGEAYGKDLDCWQLGAATFMMLTGQLPDLVNGVELPGCSPRALELCRELLAEERESRLGYPEGAKQLRGHRFFESLSWADVEACEVPPPLDVGPATQPPTEFARPTLKFPGGLSTGEEAYPRFSFTSSFMLAAGQA